MVARIKQSRKLTSVLSYNEKKVTQNDARLIHASGFIKDKDRMDYQEKMERFQRMNEQNQRTKVNMLHISLNFEPSQDLPEAQLIAIADRYMEGIGFKDQPYLVYQHVDAGHPHIHIVTNVIRADGTRIPLHNIGKDRSEPTRKAIEKEFKIDGPAHHKIHQIVRGDPQKLIYGNVTDIRREVHDVLKMVNRDYKFTTLQEYNAILRQYNLNADPGRTGSRIQIHGGLTYRLLDDQGNKTGIPMKASRFSSKPTLKNLQQKFDREEVLKEHDLAMVRQKVNWYLHQGITSLHEFTTDLQKEGIELIITHSKEGQIDSLVYVDNQLKIAGNAEQMGPKYAADVLLKGLKIQQGKAMAKTPRILSSDIQDDQTIHQSPAENQKDHQIRRRPGR